MSWGGRETRVLKKPSRSARRVPQPRVEMHRPGKGMGKTRASGSVSLTYEVCAGEACTEHASEEPRARWRAKTLADERCWAPPTGQDTVETLKQAYFQGYPESAGCVQGSIDSRNSAIHNAYHTPLRPSSVFKPRHSSLKVVN